LFSYAEDKGLLAQISTGEGKSMIVAMPATLNALIGKKVDIVTSNGVLATRDARHFGPFFDLFGLSCDAVFLQIEKEDLQACYSKDIVYGSINNFQGDCLYDDFSQRNHKNGRPYNVIIVDEADTAMTDNFNCGTMLSMSYPLFDYF
jgi:preprotein translocase subunit SecA